MKPCLSEQFLFPSMEVGKETNNKKASSPSKAKANKPYNNKFMPKVYTKKLEKSFGKTSIKISVTKTGVTTVTITVNKEIK